MGGADGSTRLPMGPPNIEVFMQTKMLQTNFSFFCHKIETKVGTIWPLWQFLMKGTTSFLSFLLSSLSLSLSLFASHSFCLSLTLLTFLAFSLWPTVPLFQHLLTFRSKRLCLIILFFQALVDLAHVCLRLCLSSRIRLSLCLPFHLRQGLVSHSKTSLSRAIENESVP